MDTIKEFEGSKIQYYFEDIENEEYFSLNVSDVTQDADKEAVMAVGSALATLIDGPLSHAKVIETHRLVR